MSTDLQPPLTPSGVIPHALGPLGQSHAYDELESDLKAIFMEVFEAQLRPRLNEVNTLGVPHRAPFPVVTQAVKLEGLAVEREQAAEAYTRELLRAWRARNPKRGLHFLTHYLQMLWPGQWEAHQLWHPVSGVPYPQGVTRSKLPGHFMTSRVMVAVDVDDPTGVALLKMRGSFRTVLAARLVILMALLRRFRNTEDSGRPVRMAASSDALQLYGIDAVYASAKKGGVSFPPIDPGPQGAVISGRVWLDANSDGAIAGESGAQGIGVSVEGPDGIVAGTATTDSAGHYSITVDPLFAWFGLSYRVFFSHASYSFNTTAGADNDLQAGGNAAGNSGYFTLQPGGSYTANAAVQLISAPPAAKTVMGVVWDEPSSDGTLPDGLNGSGKSKIAGVAVELRTVGTNNGTLEGTGQIVATTTTDSQGQWSFDIPDSGATAFFVIVRAPAGYGVVYSRHDTAWDNNHWWGDFFIDGDYYAPIVRSQSAPQDWPIDVGSGQFPPGFEGGNVSYFVGFKSLAVTPASNIVLSLAFDGTEGATFTTDSSPHAQAVTLHGMSLTTAGPQSGSACAVATGTAFNRVEVAAHASMVFGAQDFSVSGWVDADATQPHAYPVLFETFDPTGGSNWTPGALSVCASRAEYPGKVVVFCYNYSSSTPMLVSTDSVIGVGWVKWELRRVGNTVSLLIAEAVQATQTFSGAVNSSAQPYFFGGDSNAAANPAVALSGKLDNCIVTIG